MAVRKGSVTELASDERLARMREQHEELMVEARERGRRWKAHRDDYASLKERLASLPDRATVEAMVPLGKKAFMQGHLVHTNEVMVLLGDNWFAERSAKQAAEICQRRIEQCEKNMQDVEKEMDLLRNWKRGTEAAVGGGDGIEDQGLEIKEEYDEEAEKEWRKRHRQRVREEKLREKEIASSLKSSKVDEEIWRRLEELEIEEELEKHLEETEEAEEVGEDKDEPNESDHSSDLSTSPGISDEGSTSEEEEEDVYPEPKPASHDRRVSFGGEASVDFHGFEPVSVIANEPICLFEFEHSKDAEGDLPPPRGSFEDCGDVRRIMPSELEHLVKNRTRRRSILKPFNASDLHVNPDLASESGPETNKLMAVKYVDAIGDVIVERKVTAVDVKQSEPAPPPQGDSKKVSRFKRSRTTK